VTPPILFLWKTPGTPTGAMILCPRCAKGHPEFAAMLPADEVDDYDPLDCDCCGRLVHAGKSREGFVPPGPEPAGLLSAAELAEKIGRLPMVRGPLIECSPLDYPASARPVHVFPASNAYVDTYGTRRCPVCNVPGFEFRPGALPAVRIELGHLTPAGIRCTMHAEHAGLPRFRIWTDAGPAHAGVFVTVHGVDLALPDGADGCPDCAANDAADG
jgi:hypothetical protein